MELVHAIWTLVLLLIFVGIVIWAYSSKRRQRFEEAARLPLNDDDSPTIEAPSIDGPTIEAPTISSREKNNG